MARTKRKSLADVEDQTAEASSAMRITTNTRPTEEAYGELQRAYNYFNAQLWGDRLPPCLLTLPRKGRRTLGYFASSRFEKANGTRTDEIALNQRHMGGRSIKDVLSTLVHEMAHLWQQHFGRPSRSAYHNKEWAGEMLRIGLHPSHTGAPGGRMTGQQMSHYITPGGRFEKAASDLLASGFTISWRDTEPVSFEPNLPVEMNGRTRSGQRAVFTCPHCKDKASGKSSLSLICGHCDRQMVP